MTSNTMASSRVMTFSPSQEEFRDFGRYVAYMESQGAHRAGMARVIPPKGWRARSCYDDLDDLVISAPIQQVVTGQSGLFTQYNIQKKPMTLLEFQKMSGLDKFRSPRYMDQEELERKFWKNLTFNPPLYGADVSGTLYDPDVVEWNLGHLNSILEVVETDSVGSGITAPFLDFGMWKSAFAWHTEDMDLYRLSYLHFGQPRSWYAVPPEYGKRLERLAKGFFPGNAQSCEAFLRHKMTLISPSVLKKYGIPFEKVTQEAGQFIVSFPFCYRAGYNHGFNGTESVNFAMQRWIDYGKQAMLCSCRQDVVKISMDVFVRKFQPDRYKLWKAGKDVAVVDHTKPSSEASEFLNKDVATVDHTSSEASESFNKDVAAVDHTKPSSEAGEILKMDVVAGDHVKPTPETVENLKVDGMAVNYTKHKAKASTVLSKDKAGRLKKVNRITEASRRTGSTDQDFMICQDIKPDANSTNKTEQEVPKIVSIHHDMTLDVKEDVKEADYNKKKLSLKESLTKVTSRPETGKLVKSVSKKEKDVKPQSKPPQTRTSTKKPSARRSPSKKDRNGVQALDPNPPEEVRSVEDPTTHRVFQRTLSPLDVLHVHSYAKGDYGDTAMEEEESAKAIGLVQQGVEESVADMGQEENLGHLPGGHPLMKEEDPSEQETLERAPCPTPQQDALQGELWARPLTHLWQNRPSNLKKEREFNLRCASKPPYCSICSLFSTHHQAQCAAPPVAVSEWMKTKPLIPESCFTITTEEDSRQRPVTRGLEEDGTSVLVSCSQCSVRVHASCYGVDPSSVSLEWKCARCTANAMTENCCLCALRGGALHRANNNKWVHVLCAVAVLEARFVNVSERSPVDLSGIPLQRFKLKCYYCKKRAKKASGCCVQCSHGRCPTAYHPTCAQAAGVLMQPDDWPFVVHVTCCRHKGPAPIERDKAAMLDLAVGQKVICKHKNGRYYQCDVVQLSNETFYEVNFDDGSFSDNLFPEDIVSRDCTQLGPPLPGDVVQVRWTDGLVYGAKFVSTHVIQMYLVEFEDGSQLTAKRDDVYTLDEQLPKRVKSRLSKASDMRFDGIFEETEILQESKRQRVINSRYRGDYIEPVIYRAIME